MPPQKKKGTKIQVKNQQKIEQAQDHIEENNQQGSNDEQEISQQDQIKQDSLFDESDKSQIRSGSLSEQNNVSQASKRGRKRKVNIQKEVSKDSPQENAVQLKQPTRTRRKQSDQNNVNNKQKDDVEEMLNEDTVSEVKTSNNSKRKNISDSKKKNDSASKKNENLDQEEQKNLQIIIDSQEDDKEISSQSQPSQLTSNQNTNSDKKNEHSNSPKEQQTTNNQLINKPIKDIQKDSNEKKKLTIQEMESISKLLSIQVDGLKMKEHQMQTNSQIQNNYHNHYNMQKPQNKFIPNQYHNGPDPNHSINNLLNGLNTMKKLKPNNDFQTQKFAIKQQNINKLMSQLNSNDNHIDIEQQQHKKYQHHNDEQDDMEINILNELEQLSVKLGYKNQQQKVFQRVPLKSITPQNNIMLQQGSNYQIQKQQNIYPQYKQANNQEYQNAYLRKNITPNVKPGMGNSDSNGSNPQFSGKTQTQLNYQRVRGNSQIIRENTHTMNPIGKTTPMNNNNKDMNGQLTLQNSGSSRTSRTNENTQQQQAFNVDNEIQERIETIKSNIGPLLECLNSDLLGLNNQNLQKQQQPEYSNNLLSGKIYQDMRERRTYAGNEGYNYLNTQSQNVRGRSITPTILGNRRPFDKEIPTQPHNQGVINHQRNITPIRGPNQNYQMNNQSENHIRRNYEKQPGRNYDARAGDWLCGKCKNFNFAYRNICNRCGQVQDESVYMVHPEITSEALDLIHQLNHSGLRKVPIQTEYVKKIQNDYHQNKENQKNLQNLTTNNTNNNDNQTIYTNNSKTPYQRYPANNEDDQYKVKNSQTINRRYQQPTYKELQQYENNLEINKQIQNTQNNNKQSQNSNETSENKIIFIDNSSAQHNSTFNQIESKSLPQNNPNNNTQTRSLNDTSNINSNNNTNSNNNNNTKVSQRAVDPRIKIR